MKNDLSKLHDLTQEELLELGEVVHRAVEKWLIERKKKKG